MTSANNAVSPQAAVCISDDARRRRCFQANVRGNLESDPAADAIGGRALIAALGAAYESVRHMIDARSRVKIGAFGVYSLLQIGVARRRSDLGIADIGPLAERVLGRVDARFLETMSEGERAALAAAVDKGEITRKHMVDIRLRAPLPGYRLYLNFIAGPDRRSMVMTPSEERRGPANEDAGLIILTLFVIACCALGATVIGFTAFTLAEAMTSEESRSVLSGLVSGLLGG